MYKNRQYTNIFFREKSHENYTSPLEKDNYLEMDTTNFLDIDDIKKYYPLIGVCN